LPPANRHPKGYVPESCGAFRDKDNNRLFQDQTILYGFDPFDVPCDLDRFVDGVLRINEAAQLDDALASFDTDLE
jgi:hypothetical protein